MTALPGVRAIPLTKAERGLLVLQIRGVLCPCCGEPNPRASDEDVCVACDATLNIFLVARAVEAAEKRIAASVLAVAVKVAG